MQALTFNPRNAVVINPTMQLRWYQQEAIQAVIDYYVRGNTGNPVIALPTGTGKSLVQGGFMAHVLAMWPRQRFLCLTHVQELIEQNAADLLEYWPDAPVGIYSAGLNQREFSQPIIFGGVASVVNCIELFGWRDLLLVDECHLISSKDASMYSKIIAGLRKINPHLKVIGLTATPYRTGQGLLTDGGLFTDIVYDMTTMSAFNLLIEQGFLCPLRPKATDVEIDVSQLKANSDGNYKLDELQSVSDIDAITKGAVREMCEQGYHKRAWLTFASGVKHAEHINAEILRQGVPSGIIHGDLPKDVRKETIRQYKHGILRSIVNYGVLTTGFNYKPIDMIAHLRATQSTGLWVQTLGRGTRPSPETGKQFCLVLDFAGNTRRLGPINDPVIPKKRGSKPGGGVPPCKICPACGFYNHTRATMCCNCPHQFPANPNIMAEAGTDELLRTEQPLVEMFTVGYVLYSQKSFRNGVPFLCTAYHCGAKGMQKFEDRVWLENHGEALSYAKDWWTKRYCGNNSTPDHPQAYSNYVPANISEALELTRFLRTPRIIRVRLDKKEPSIIGYDF